jgi:hypothetical protein
MANKKIFSKKQEKEPRKSKSQNKLKHQLNKWLRILADSPLPAIAVVATLVLARWWQNSDFSYLSEAYLPVIVFAVPICVIFYAYRLFLGRGFALQVATIATSYVIYSFSFVQNSMFGKKMIGFLPDSWHSELTQNLYLFFLIAILVGLLAWLFNKYLSDKKWIRSLQLYKILIFAVVFVFGVQLVKTVQRTWVIHRELSYHYPAPTAQPAKTASSKPDIYYLLFDRYGNKGELEKNFYFDNSDIYNYLASQGFTNRSDAYGNYPFTMSSVSSTMAMNYFPEFQDMFAGDTDWQSAAPYRSVLSNPPIAQLLKKSGYDYNQISSWWDFTRVGIQADSNPTISFRLNVFGYHNYLTDLQRDIINKSAVSAWLKKGVSFGDKKVLKYDLNRNPQQNFEAQMSAIKNLASRGNKSTPQFSFAHVLVPHDPYIYDASGKTPWYDSARTDNGVDETVKYTNAVTYLNTRIKDTVGYIRQHSPNAVIVIQADEGPYPKEFRYKLEPDHYYDPANLSLDKMKQKFGVFASYYLPGVDPNTHPINASVNTFRYILNNYVGYNLPLLPDCHFSTGDKYTVYQYQDQTAKINGKDENDCKQYL